MKNTKILHRIVIAMMLAVIIFCSMNVTKVQAANKFDLNIYNETDWNVIFVIYDVPYWTTWTELAATEDCINIDPRGNVEVLIGDEICKVKDLETGTLVYKNDVIKTCGYSVFYY